MRTFRPTKLSYLIEVPHVADEGSLCFMEGTNHIPFEIKRIYYIFDVDNNAVRGHHAHKKTKQVLFCIRGSVTISLDDGISKEEIKLDSPDKGIYLGELMWHEMTDFTPDTVLLVLASDIYLESDYLRDYTGFQDYIHYEKMSRDGKPLIRYYTPLTNLN